MTQRANEGIRPGSHHRKDGRTVSGRRARQGEIVLRTPTMRAIFIAGLIGAAVIAIAIRLYYTG